MIASTLSEGEYGQDLPAEHHLDHDGYLAECFGKDFDPDPQWDSYCYSVALTRSDVDEVVSIVEALLQERKERE